MANNQMFRQAAGGLTGTPASGEAFAGQLTAGRFNNDARSDLAVGVPNDSQGAGSVYVIFGATTGLDGSLNQIITSAAGGSLGEGLPGS